MFFSLEPETFFPHAQIDAVQFPDDLSGNRIIEKTFKGPLHQQLREPIEVRVLPERIEILSHPGADRSIRIEGLKTYRVSSRRCRAVSSRTARSHTRVA